MKRLRARERLRVLELLRNPSAFEVPRAAACCFGRPTPFLTSPDVLKRARSGTGVCKLEAFITKGYVRHKSSGICLHLLDTSMPSQAKVHW